MSAPYTGDPIDDAIASGEADLEQEHAKTRARIAASLRVGRVRRADLEALGGVLVALAGLRDVTRHVVPMLRAEQAERVTAARIHTRAGGAAAIGLLVGAHASTISVTASRACS